MKVLMLNGSPHKGGCTWTALCEAAKELEKEGIETEILHVGGRQVWGCMGCGACARLGKCVHDDDLVNTAVAKMKECDGLIVGSLCFCQRGHHFIFRPFLLLRRRGGGS